MLNFQRVGLFLDNFAKLKGFDPARDRIVIMDCSDNREEERERTRRFAQEHGWELGGPTIKFVSRPNWGIDQGARIDYLDYHLDDAAPFVWQFQEHYLDNTSDYARWGSSAGPLAGTVKEDVLPDDGVLDLDLSERAFADPAVSAVFSSRSGIGLFPHSDGSEWFYADGANFGFRTSVAREAFNHELLDDYRLVFDGSYRWCQFIEFEFSRQLSRGAWFDLSRQLRFDDHAAVKAAEREAGRSLSSSASEKDARVVARYLQRMQLARRLPSDVRRALLRTSFPFFGKFQSQVFLPLRAKLMKRGIDSPAWFRELW